MRKKGYKPRPNDRGRNGMAMVEFALLFPIQLFFILAILEIALIQVGRLMVSYAAYCAAHAELLNQDPTEAAAIALIPLCDEETGTYYEDADIDYEGEPPEHGTGHNFPGWGYINRWDNARRRVAVYRLADSSSNILNRSTVIQDDGEEFHTNVISQHNIGVEVRFLYRLRLPLSLLSILWPAEEIEDFRDWHDSLVVIHDDEPHIVLRERWLMPNKGKLIRSTLPVMNIEGEYRGGEPVKEVPEDIREAPPEP